ncbi:MAG: hypothetical protein JW969_16505, partial [Spirochaetales bacterium]|nr:hypothetical protein [Spirochaetales bacterium]
MPLKKKSFIFCLALLLMLITTVLNAAEWAPYTYYSAGTVVTYNGASYTCRQSHTSLPGWEPSNVPALWIAGGTSATATPTQAVATSTPTWTQSVNTSTPTRTQAVSTSTPTPTQGTTLVDITNLPGTISAQYTDSPSGEDINKLIDNSSSTKYLTFHASGWVQFSQTTTSVITQYTITSANDAAERDPYTWSLQGSNNGSTWTTIDSRSGEDFPNRFQTRSFTFANSTAYTYYRMNMSNNSGTILQLAEWELWGTTGGTVNTPTPSNTSVTVNTPTPVTNLVDITNLAGTVSAQYYDSPSGEEIDKLIDNSSSTKYLTFHASGWVQLSQTSLSVVTQYTITSANDAAERDPYTWTLQGSTNGSSWVTLDSRSGEDFPNRFQLRTFTFSNSTSYNYYRLNMTNNSGTILQLAEWELWGTVTGSVTATPTSPTQNTATPTATPTRTPTPAGNVSVKRIVGYYTEWSIYSAHNMYYPSNIPWNSITHVLYAFARTSGGQIALFDSWAATGSVVDGYAGTFGSFAVQKAAHPEVKILISVGGWTLSGEFHTIASTDATRNAFADSCVAFLNTYPFFDGVDIDWEYPGIPRDPDLVDNPNDTGNPAGPEDKQNWTLLLQTMRSKLPAGKLLTIAGPAGYDKMVFQDP